MKLSLLGFILFLSVCSVNVSAQSRSKQYVAKVYTLNRKAVQGILHSVNNEGIYLVRKIGDTPSFINALEIKKINIRKKGKAGTGTTIGFFTGLALGAGTAIALHSDDKVKNNITNVGAVLFTFATTAIGGSITGKPEAVIWINGIAHEYSAVSQKLKSYAIESHY